MLSRVLSCSIDQQRNVLRTARKWLAVQPKGNMGTMIACLRMMSTKIFRVNSQTCPECNEHLSVKTLRRPRVVNNYLSKLKINCDYASRGCLEYIPVENLESHVARCGFAPVSCSNENCCMVINKQEREHHETVVCEYRKPDILEENASNCGKF